MPFLRKVLAFLRRGAELFPFTLLGLGLVLGAAYAFVVYGIRKVDLVLFAMAGITLAVAACAMLATSITAIVLAVRLRKAPSQGALRLECDAPTTTDFSLSSLWFVPLVYVKWSWSEPRAEVKVRAARRRLHETATPQRRGLFGSVRRRIEISDAFRLTKITLLHDETRSVHALPSVGALQRMNILRSLSNGDDFPNPTSPAEGDRSDLRRYSPGDPVRFVLWRVFAKTRQMVIRVPERAASIATKATAYLVAGDGDEAAAGAARLALESGALGKGWVFGADGGSADATTLDAAHRLLAGSVATTAASSGAGLGSFLDRNAKSGRVLVFVPARKGEWVTRAVQAAARRTGGSATSPIEFLVCCDGIDARDRSTWLRRFMIASEDSGSGSSGNQEARVSAVASNEVLRALAATRARVMLVDRRSGRMQDAREHLRRVERDRPAPAPTVSAAPAAAPPLAPTGQP